MGHRESKSLEVIKYDKVAHEKEIASSSPIISNDISDGQDEIIGKMTVDLNDFCKKLNNKNCNIEEAYRLLKKYEETYHRVLYSVISDYVFAAMESLNVEKGDDEQLPLQFKMSELVHFANGQGNEKVTRITIKLYDHINLATRQYISFKQSEAEYREKFRANIEPVKNDLIKESNSQLLTLVGMFTALAFLIFGGISSLDNLFSEMNNLPMLKLVALGCVWGMCILNLIFVFLVCVGKMTNLPFKFSEKPDAGIREKYAVVWFSNLILLILFLFSVGVSYINKYGLNEWFVNWTKENPVLFFVFFIFILIVLFGIGMYFIFHKNKD